MLLKLNYLYPGFVEPRATNITSVLDDFDDWVDMIMKNNPGAIFYFTTETTDIFGN